MKLTQKRLKEFLDYDPETGIFVWKVYRGGSAKAGTVAGCLDKPTGYLRMGIDSKRYLAHRLAFLWMDGYLPENFVDHEDRIRINNKWDNLREVSKSCNNRNCKIRRTNKSGVTGVSWNSGKNKWTATIKTQKRMYLGHFNTIVEAAQARWDAEVLHNYPNCNTTSSAYIYLQTCANQKVRVIDYDYRRGHPSI